MVVTTVEQGGAIRRELPELHPDQVIDEPFGRDTAPCIGLAATIAEHRVKAPVILSVLPADQEIARPAKLRSLLRRARAYAERGEIVTFGIKPVAPSTRFGYLERGERLSSGSAPAFRLKRFREKPAESVARRLLRSGRFYWNSGIFVFRSDVILKAIQTHLPTVGKGLESLRRYCGTAEQDAVIRREYRRFPRISIDYGVMEKWGSAVVIEADMAWDDIGGWEASASRWKRDRDGNAVRGLFCAVESRDCLIYSDDGGMVGMIGVNDLIVVRTGDATLVCRRKDAERIKDLVRRMEAERLEAFL